jgi:AcrR family transcriptional regulator
MARLKDEARRQAILEGAKDLFAKKGYASTSISDIVQATGFPVGSIYTYFKSKEEIVKAIIDEGWGEFSDKLLASVAAESRPEKRLSLLLDEFLPSLLADSNLIAILLTEASLFADIGPKVEALTGMLYGILNETRDRHGVIMDYPKDSLRAGLMVFFLGILHTIRLSQRIKTDIDPKDILDFVRRVIHSSLGIDIPAPKD